MQGLLEHPKEIVDYFNCRGVSVIFLFRRNLLRRVVSTLANSYDRYAKLLNGTHKSHVHSKEEVSFPILLSFHFFSFYTENETHTRLLSGWYAFKVQAYHKFDVVAGWSERYGEKSCNSVRILQHHTTYDFVLRGSYQKSNRKSLVIV